MKGKRINNWLVLYEDINQIKMGTYWICECQCDNKTRISIKGVDLRIKPSKSCGCITARKKIKSNEYNLNGTYGIGYTVKGEKFYFDLEDYDLIKSYYWYINSKGYPCTKSNKKEILMHRLILNTSDEECVDHIEHNEYDNRKSKLRATTHDKNMLNKNIYKNNTSGYPGVTWHKRDEKWVVRIQLNKKEKELGRYENLNDAVKVRRDAEIKYYGEYRNKLINK